MLHLTENKTPLFQSLEEELLSDGLLKPSKVNTILGPLLYFLYLFFQNIETSPRHKEENNWYESSGGYQKKIVGMGSCQKSPISYSPRTSPKRMKQVYWLKKCYFNFSIVTLTFNSHIFNISRSKFLFLRELHYYKQV